jgi:hypothetical protein
MFLPEIEKKRGMFRIAHTRLNTFFKSIFFPFVFLASQCIYSRERLPIAREQSHRAKLKLPVANHFVPVTDRVTANNDVPLYDSPQKRNPSIIYEILCPHDTQRSIAVVIKVHLFTLSGTCLIQYPCSYFVPLT